MAHYIVTGGIPLSGSLTIAGRKNAALKLIAASILAGGPVTLSNVPDINDVRVMLQIFEALGGTVTKLGTEEVVLDPAGITTSTIPEKFGRSLRASLVFVGPLLARFGKATFPHPGGCVIGKRTIGPHLLAFEHLGAKITFDGSTYVAEGTLVGSRLYLKERSVTGTENVIMAACGAKGTTTIYNAAEEPHIVNLCQLLRSLGYSITGDGTSTVVVEGNPAGSTKGASCAVIPDDIEVGTFAAAVLVTKGEVTLQKVGTYALVAPILSKLEDFAAEFSYTEDRGGEIALKPSHHMKAANVQIGPWPMFPPDLQSPFAVVATQATGTSMVHDWMYEGRLGFLDLLQRMEANTVICDPHRAIITGPTPLHHASLISPDLRAGAALLVAALAAEGQSVIEHAELIDRGYASIDVRLRSLGANITRHD